MTGFVTTHPAADGAPIPCGSFFPAVDPAAMRLQMQRLDGSVSPQQLREALSNAIGTAITELAVWVADQQAAGYATLDAVPSVHVDGSSLKVLQWLRAVRCYAHAELTERLRDYDLTPKGQERADQLTPTVDNSRRDALWALADVRGLPRSTVELI